MPEKIMTRFIYDQFAKDYLEEFLSPYGQVVVPKRVASEVQEIDLYFIPTEETSTNFKPLGLLGELASPPGPSIFEPFRNPVTPTEICDCLFKVLAVRRELLRQSRRQNALEQKQILPKLWILTPTASSKILAGFNAFPKPNGMPGLHFLGESLASAIIVLHQLPQIPETLWLRLLGRSGVQQRALDELEALPINHPLRASANRLLINLQKNLAARQDLERTDTELIMRLAPLYQQDQEQAIQQGIQTGIQQGIQTGIQQGERLVIENLLRTRFGTLDPEILSTIDPLLALTPEEFTPLLLQLSREELVARFAQDS
jgi:hypothetical protein